MGSHYNKQKNIKNEEAANTQRLLNRGLLGSNYPKGPHPKPSARRVPGAGAAGAGAAGAGAAPAVEADPYADLYLYVNAPSGIINEQHPELAKYRWEQERLRKYLNSKGIKQRFGNSPPTANNMKDFENFKKSYVGGTRHKKRKTKRRSTHRRR